MSQDERYTPEGSEGDPGDADCCSGRHQHSGRPSHPQRVSQAATLSAQPGTKPRENLTANHRAFFDPLSQDDPPQMPVRPSSRTREARLPPSRHISVDNTLPTSALTLAAAYTGMLGRRCHFYRMFYCIERLVTVVLPIRARYSPCLVFCSVVV